MSESLETLDAFLLAVELSELVYSLTASFPPEERYGIKAQMRGASISVVSNIAEGYGRLTYGERRQFLSHARGSLFEIEAQCIVAHRLKFLTDDANATLRAHAKRTCIVLTNYIEWVRSRPTKTKTKVTKA
jgi:four helix bundle protein